MNHEFLPLVHSGLKRRLLWLLKRSGGLTVKQLAVKTGMSLNAVRHHVREMERERLLSYQRQHQGVGAPTFIYRLTPAGHALFPHQYEAALGEVLDQIVEEQGREAAVRLLRSRYEKRSRDLTTELGAEAPAVRLDAVAERLSAEGYMAEASSDAVTGTLVQHNCPIQSVAERFPEVCAAEARFLQAVLGAEVHREQHILAGCNACEYRVRFNPPTSVGEIPRREEMV
jgi:DeoR family transcriptional regulator, suf operon transcriptional repressor